MIAGLAYVEIGIAVVVGLLAVVLGLVGRRPDDISIGATALVELALVVQIVVAIVAPLVGNAPTGDLVEFWIYLVTAALLPPVAVLWGLVDRGRWSTVVLGVASLAVAVMLWRMLQIWTVQQA
ncbi:hypothetical protein QT381_06385 [Galbitalea sp. SE-J8]|uniref:hypothetical protein n=1 Tax=Galbitalea sp. SE-J8 TaxID=3054952 RepID=UPI00259CF53C|nr:hypothetical protein [Galbitalea sp. SE-J8]MDM4762630.1 hypothetical protein [Galbitalea sp. SE-J8]